MQTMERVKETVSNKIHHHDSKSDTQEDTGFEVLGMMRTRSRNNTSNILPEIPLPGRPNIERHISKIPQRDTDDGEDDELPTNLKRNLSSIPPDDYDSEDETPPTNAASLNYQQNVAERTRSSEFEEPGLLRITSDNDAKDATVPVQQRPGIERHVSAIPDDDEPRKPARRTKLERAISQIAPNDYDSDGEGTTI